MAFGPLSNWPDRRSVPMRKSLMHLVASVWVIMAFWPAGAQSQTGAAQSLMGANEPGGPAPDHDFNGTWIGPGESQLMIHVPPLTPAGQAKLKGNIPDPFSLTSNDPWKTCDTFGMPREANNEVLNIGFSTMPGRIIILENYQRVWREVWMDGRQLPKDAGQRDSQYSSRWYGYSVGHWEDPHTLVVETKGMMPQSWVDRMGYPHSASAEVVERYARTDHNHLTMTETLNDPEYYTEPFVVAKDTYKWILGQDDPKATTIPPFADEQMCVASEAIEYMNTVLVPSKGDEPIKR